MDFSRMSSEEYFEKAEDFYNGTNGEKQDFYRAVEYYRKAAEKGNADAMFALGRCYMNGQGVSSNATMAVQMFQKAAMRGHAGAQNNLGGCYYSGKGIEQDFSEAFYWFSEAAGQGLVAACRNLGICYEKGKGANQDYEEAAYWYGKAAEEGDEKAEAALDRMAEEGLIPSDENDEDDIEDEDELEIEDEDEDEEEEDIEEDEDEDFVIEDGILVEYNGSDKVVHIPSGVKSLEESVFYGNENIECVVLPNSVKEIGPGAFGACDNLEKVVIPDSVKELAGGTFTECSALKDVTLGKGIKTIEEETFFGCSSLKSIEIPEGVESIESNAFASCENLETVILPGTLESIGYGAFDSCYELTKIIFHGTEEMWDDIDKGEDWEDFDGEIEFEEENEDDLFEIEDGELIKYNGEEDDVVIPDGVTRIGERAFEDNITMNSITIPASVTEIAGNAFGDWNFACDQLTAVYYQGDLASWCEIDFEGRCANPLVYACSLYIGGKEVTSIDRLPETLEEIKDYAFYGWNGTKVVIPNAVERIGESAFRKCKHLSVVTIPSSVTEIAEDAFYYCSALEKIIFLGDEEEWEAIDKGGSWDDSTGDYTMEFKSVGLRNTEEEDEDGEDGDFEIIDGMLYKYNGEDEDVCVPDTVTMIRTGAFDENNFITTITIPRSVVEMEAFAFGSLDSACKDLTAVYYQGDLTSWCDIEFGNCSANPLSYAHDLYIDGEKVTTLEVPKTVKTIKKHAFNGWSGKEVILPDGVTTIDYSAFSDCKELETVIIPKSVTTIKDFAFSDCDNLKIIYVGTKKEWSKVDKGHTWRDKDYDVECDPNYVPGQDDWDDDKEEEDDDDFVISDGVLIEYNGNGKDICLPEGIEEIGENVFSGNNEIESIVIPVGVTKIGEGAFTGCKNLKSVIIPDGVKEIGVAAFSECSSLEKVTLGKGVEKIDEEVFYSCSTLTSIRIPDGVKRIGCDAFSFCDRLATVVLPATLEWIIDDAFEFCTELTKIRFLGTEKQWDKVRKGPEWEEYEGDVLFGEEKSPFEIRDGKLVKYHGEDEDVVIPEGVTMISDHAFDECCDFIKSVTIPKTVTKILEGAFGDWDFECTELEAVYYTGDIASWCQINFGDMYSNPLYYAHNLYIGGKQVLVMDKNSGAVAAIKQFAFTGWNGTKVYIPDGATKIGDGAFFGCEELETVTIPGSVTVIGELAFEKCDSLEKIIYIGTEEDWEDMDKDITWDGSSDNYVVEYLPEGDEDNEEEAAEAYEKAGELYRTRDYREAVEWYRRAAELGHAEAQNALGSCYKSGEGVERDYDQAFEWFLKAAEQGSIEGQYNTGCCYYYGRGVEKDQDKAVYWFGMSAAQGDEKSQKILSRLQR